ncbi:MAG: ACT domain-containing protein [Limisphaerales bacterium]
MLVQTSKARRASEVVQFSVFTPNRTGRLHELVGILSGNGVNMLALSVLDTTDSSIIRFVVDDPDHARELLDKHGFPYSESELVAVELGSATDLNRLVCALLEAELNVNYLYSFIPHPDGKSILALNMEDNEMAEQVLKQHQFRILKQTDISR